MHAVPDGVVVGGGLACVVAGGGLACVVAGGGGGVGAGGGVDAWVVVAGGG
jgi:hypothetical protein